MAPRLAPASLFDYRPLGDDNGPDRPCSGPRYGNRDRWACGPAPRSFRSGKIRFSSAADRWRGASRRRRSGRAAARRGARLGQGPGSHSGADRNPGSGYCSPRGVAEATLALLVDLVPSAEVDRFPESRWEDVLGLAVPSIALSPFEASAAAKLRFALRAFSTDSVPAIVQR